MSKLKYTKVIDESDGELSSDELKNETNQLNGKASKRFKSDSYSLFNLDPSLESDPSRRSSAIDNNQNSDGMTSLSTIHSSSKKSNTFTHNSKLENHPSTSKDLNSTAAPSNLAVKPNAACMVNPEPQQASSWLKSFLSKKRSSEIQKVEDPIALDDVYLRQFFSSTNRHPLETMDDTEQETEADPSIVLAANALSQDYSLSSDSDAEIEGEVDDEVDDSIPGDTGTSLKLWNLPYKASVDDILAFAISHAMMFVSVTIVMDKDKPNLPSGAAIATISSTIDAEAVVDALFGKAFMGREFKLSVIQSATHRRGNKRLSSNGIQSRYFSSNDISYKCFNCGEVGHRQSDCKNTAVRAPCHLCAGRDHEAGDCPNITCFRCGSFGHHSRSCRQSYSSSRPNLCTTCGSSTHDTINCELSSIQPNASPFLQSSSTRCMRCYKTNHLLCQAITALPNPAMIYCPNCGGSGHHVDYPRYDRNGSAIPCLQPRIDAYMKIPRLLKEAGNQSITRLSRDRLIDYYRDIGRDSRLYPDQLEALFPILSRNTMADNRYDSSSRSSQSNSWRLSNTDTSSHHITYTDDYDDPNDDGDSFPVLQYHDVDDRIPQFNIGSNNHHARGNNHGGRGASHINHSHNQHRPSRRNIAVTSSSSSSNCTSGRSSNYQRERNGIRYN